MARLNPNLGELAGLGKPSYCRSAEADLEQIAPERQDGRALGELVDCSAEIALSTQGPGRYPLGDGQPATFSRLPWRCSPMVATFTAFVCPLPNAETSAAAVSSEVRQGMPRCTAAWRMR